MARDVGDQSAYLIGIIKVLFDDATQMVTWYQPMALYAATVKPRDTFAVLYYIRLAHRENTT